MNPIARAVEMLVRGGLVAFPTETVYGLGADATDDRAVLRIFEAKGRPSDHPVIVHLADFAQVEQWARTVPVAAQRLATAFWPGPLTLVLSRGRAVSDVVTGGQGTVGIRVPSHPVAQALLRAFGRGIAGPSANRFGHVSPTTAQHVRAEFGNTLDLILEGGQSEVGIESTIVDVSSDRMVLLRPGIISIGQIESVVGQPVLLHAPVTPRVSGSLPSHYAPRKPTVLVDPGELAAQLAMPRSSVAVLSRSPPPVRGFRGDWIQAPAGAADYAHDLYANLRRLDEGDCDRIVIEAVPDTAEWLAVRDRIARATAPRYPEGT